MYVLNPFNLKLESEYQRIPLSKSTGPIRRRKEEIETQLDGVSARVGRVKQQMKKMGVL